MGIKTLIVLICLFFSSSVFAQDSLEYYKEHHKHIQSENFERYNLETKSEKDKLEGLNIQCESYYNQIRIYIKVIKYKSEKVDKSAIEELKELRLLRNSLCRKHIQILEKIDKITGKEKERISYWRWRYIIFLGDY